MDTARHFSAKIREHKKGISPIIATLLLILIAIAAGVVVYAYVIGFVGNTTTGGNPIVPESFNIPEWTYSSGALTVYVQNTGHNTINITSAFVLNNGGSVVSSNTTLSDTISPGSTLGIVVQPVSGVQSGQYYQVKVGTANGNYETSSSQEG